MQVLRAKKKEKIKKKGILKKAVKTRKKLKNVKMLKKHFEFDQGGRVPSGRENQIIFNNAPSSYEKL